MALAVEDSKDDGGSQGNVLSSIDEKIHLPDSVEERPERGHQLRVDLHEW